MGKQSLKSRLTKWFAYKMYVIRNSKDAHYLADETLCELLYAIGYTEVVEQYRQVKKTTWQNRRL